MYGSVCHTFNLGTVTHILEQVWLSAEPAAPLIFTLDGWRLESHHVPDAQQPDYLEVRFAPGSSDTFIVVSSATRTAHLWDVHGTESQIFVCPEGEMYLPRPFKQFAVFVNEVKGDESAGSTMRECCTVEIWDMVIGVPLHRVHCPDVSPDNYYTIPPDGSTLTVTGHDLKKGLWFADLRANDTPHVELQELRGPDVQVRTWLLTFIGLKLMLCCTSECSTFVAGFPQMVK